MPIKTFFAAALLASTFAGFGAAGAMPLAPAAPLSADVIEVAQGCGPGFFRGPRGRCRPMAGPAIVVRRPFARRCAAFGPRGRCIRFF